MNGLNHTIPHFDSGRFQAVAIGSSTGGPGLLRDIISGLPADLPFPILIAQHLPPAFTLQLSQQMANESALTVVHAQDGMEVLPGVVYVAPGREHMRVLSIRGKKIIEVNDQPGGLFFKPSVDELFYSVAKAYGRNSLGVVMTGIGHDGTAGATAIKQAGGVIITQSQATCSVYGMPRSCDEAGLSDASLCPEDICECLLQSSTWYRHPMTTVGIFTS